MKQSYKLVLFSLIFLLAFQNITQAQFGNLEAIEPTDIFDVDVLVPGTVYTIALKYDTVLTPGADVVDSETIDITVLPSGGITILSGPTLAEDGCTIITTFTPLVNNVEVLICADDNTPLTVGSKAIYRTAALSVPVQFSELYGSQQNNEVKLEWETAIEVGNEKFIVERAYADSGFQPIGELKGAGNSIRNLTYDFMDLNPKSGINAYRIKQVDFNGTSDYSETVRVIYFSAKDIQLAPNPASISQDNPMLYIHSDHSNTVSVGIYNVIGKLMSDQTYTVNEGQNRFAIRSQDLHEGLYLIKINMGDYSSTQKLYLEK